MKHPAVYFWLQEHGRLRYMRKSGYLNLNNLVHHSDLSLQVFDQGWWQKDSGLYREIQKANWADVILDEKFKVTLQKDVNGFFTSEQIYAELQIPWKRGLVINSIH